MATQVLKMRKFSIVHFGFANYMRLIFAQIDAKWLSFFRCSSFYPSSLKSTRFDRSK